MDRPSLVAINTLNSIADYENPEVRADEAKGKIIAGPLENQCLLMGCPPYTDEVTQLVHYSVNKIINRYCVKT